MNIVEAIVGAASLTVGARDSDVADLRHGIVAGDPGSDVGDRAYLGRRERLAADAEERAGQIEPMLPRPHADPHGGAGICIEHRRSSAAFPFREPAHDAPDFVPRGQMSGGGQAFPPGALPGRCRR